jgi:glycosyltransferase involved in cell wall biosynthesis
LLSQHPEIIELDSRFSTTSSLTRQKPLFEINLESKIKSKLFSALEYFESIDGGLRCAGYFKYSFPDKPLLTVITVVYNGDKHLEQTIQSVINQSYNNVEYIVIDGCSTDRTKAIIHQYQAMIDYWVSEPDKGIADAMNKGISLSTGDYIIFIHSDDYFYTNKVVENALMNIDKDCDIAVFQVLFGQKFISIIPRQFNWWINFKIPACHQGVICKLNLFKNLGGFDNQFKIDMDYDFLLRAYRKGIFVQQLNLVLAVMRDTGISSRKDFKSILERLAEERLVHNKNCPNILMEIIYKVYWFFYLNYKKLMLLSN